MPSTRELFAKRTLNESCRAAKLLRKLHFSRIPCVQDQLKKDVARVLSCISQVHYMVNRGVIHHVDDRMLLRLSNWRSWASGLAGLESRRWILGGACVV